MLLDILFQIWRRLSERLQWWLLWLFNAKFMISVSGVIYDEAGRILLQRHRHWVDDVWGLPGGIVQRDETLENGLVREVREETGLRIKDIGLIQMVSGYHMRMEAYFQARLDEPEPIQEIRVQQNEVIEARFFSQDELPANLLPLQRKMIEATQAAVYAGTQTIGEYRHE